MGGNVDSFVVHVPLSTVNVLRRITHLYCNEADFSKGIITQSMFEKPLPDAHSSTRLDLKRTEIGLCYMNCLILNLACHGYLAQNSNHNAARPPDAVLSLFLCSFFFVSLFFLRGGVGKIFGRFMAVSAYIREYQFKFGILPEKMGRVCRRRPEPEKTALLYPYIQKLCGDGIAQCRY